MNSHVELRDIIGGPGEENKAELLLYPSVTETRYEVFDKAGQPLPSQVNVAVTRGR